MQIQPMTLASSTLQIQRHDYSGDFNIVIFVGLCTLPFDAINIDVVSLFTDSSFLFLANLYCINVLYQFERMSFDFVKKINK
ncbi:transmembrane protein, putative [Medicago truncatula]|uniref:Transmembrane protein, putative n=1 Tax=Medicago truncatula TaxID=3880 RepID=G7JUT9_MEDTR|nr:transmembrane protein, putative [Medicago truncatula]